MAMWQNSTVAWRQSIDNKLPSAYCCIETEYLTVSVRQMGAQRVINRFSDRRVERS